MNKLSEFLVNDIEARTEEAGSKMLERMEHIEKNVTRELSEDEKGILSSRILDSLLSSLNRAIFREKVKKGKAFILSDSEHVDTLKMFKVFGMGFVIGVGFINTGDVYRCAVCICTPEDTEADVWSNRMARGLIGYRLCKQVAKGDFGLSYAYDSEVPDVTIVRAVYYELLSRALKDDRSVPRFFKKMAQSGRLFDSMGGDPFMEEIETEVSRRRKKSNDRSRFHRRMSCQDLGLG